MTIWFTSDTHFGHANIIKYTNRPFKNVSEMDDELICRWNKTVQPNDTIYHLGDFCFGDPNKYYPLLNGFVYVIPGSHDPIIESTIPRIPKERVLARQVTIKLPMKKDGHSIRLTMSHYAMRSWPLSHYGSWHLFGHHHGTLPPYGMSFDVGVDSWDFYPISLETVGAAMNTLEPIVDYSKGK